MFADDFGNPLLRDNFEEILIPDSISYMPQTLGWYFLYTVILLLFFWLLVSLYRCRQKNQYRRTALQTLQRLEENLQHPDARQKALLTLPVLVKQTAIDGYGHQKVAALTGSDWLCFLDKTFRGDGFTCKAGKLLPVLAYSTPKECEQVSAEQINQLVALIRQWIRSHHADI